ncbi:MAG TPA: thioredoxin family protein, partial [Blastocatellia bacterium]|nr:thioredoxin family protein [Blastocatellia bacterium]
MKVKAPGLLVLLLCAIAPGARAGGFETFTWNDVTRDVYIDNEVDRSAQVLMLDAPRRVAVISPKLDRALVLDVGERTVSTVAKEAFRMSPDRASATSDSAAPSEAAGKFAQVDGSTYLFAVNGRAVLIKPHPGLTGEVSEARLMETVPVWRSLMEAYKPAPEAVSALRAANAEAAVTVVLGSWCPDSKNYVPRLLKALHEAGNDRLRVNIIGIDSQFHDPMATIQQRGITNVPTLIVERGGREIGRVVETPASETMEQDLAAILNGKQPPHPGRWERGPKIAQGLYVYKDASGKERGRERWELYSTAEGGNLVHSEITTGDTATEIWHRVDAARKPSMVEITRRRGPGVARARYRFGDGSLTARLRGNGSGVVEQTL